MLASLEFPRLIQGGMGVGVSAHRLAGSVAALGGVGTISSVDLRRHHPDTAVILLVSALEPTLMLEAMRETDFAREAIHPDHGPRSLDWFLQLYAWHGRHHIGHLRLTAAA